MARFRFFLVFLLGIALAVSAGCSCGDDDDDDDRGDDDDADDDDSLGGDDDDDDDDDAGEVPDVQALLTRIVEQLDTSGDPDDGAFVAYAVASKLGAGDTLEPYDGETDAPDGDYWFAFLDDQPFADYEHDARFVYTDPDTGSMDVENQRWWPVLNDTGLFVADVEIVRMFSPITEDVTGSSKSGARPKLGGPEGDYGDAPDDTLDPGNVGAYVIGDIDGHFPTLWNTDNSINDRPGGHTLVWDEEWIGDDVSGEEDADDPADPDGVPNLVNNDKDNEVYWQFYIDPQTFELTVRFLVKVSVHEDAPDTTRYINILVDTNRDGEWKRNNLGVEWLVQNFPVDDVAPGESKWVLTDPVEYPVTNGKFGWESWIRVSLTREEVDGDPFGEDGWDGSGEFGHGEIEDHYFNFLSWYGDDDDDDDDDDTDPDDDADDDDDDDGPPDPEDPDGDDPTEDVDEGCVYICSTDNIPIPTVCRALVINLGDAPGKGWMKRNGEKANAFFGKKIGEENVEYLDKPTAAEAKAAIEAFFDAGLCLDENWLYIVGHGGSSGYIAAQNGHGRVTVKDINDLLTANPHCPNPMNYYAGECRQPGYCNTNLIIQSCHSGNFTEGDDSMAIPGVNILTSASKDKSSYGQRNGDGSYVSNAFWDAFKDNQADNPPNGDGDGTVSPEEAMKWAEERYGGGRSDPQRHNGSDCNCVCETLDESWQDPPDDEFLWEGTGTPGDLPILDILFYGVGTITDYVVAYMQMAAILPLSGPGFFEFYFAIDVDPFGQNYEGEGPPHDSDRVYIAAFNNQQWNIFRFDAVLGEFQPQLTNATVDVIDNFLFFMIPQAEGLDFQENLPPIRFATWTNAGTPSDNQDDFGDETDVQGSHPPLGAPPVRLSSACETACDACR
ncbi:hypothetical protein K8I61_01040 [bacterium]|nr:hypothetical protein [bacterium]